jgi:hypothetical protein
MPSRLIPYCLAFLASAALTVSCAGQVMRDPGTMPDGRRMPIPGLPQHPQVKPAAATSAAPAQPAVPQDATVNQAPAAPSGPVTAPSLLDQPAQPAKIALANGRLSVEADNSSLTEILHQLAASSGMKVDGISRDQRIFGRYGPGNPRDILSSLLDDAGYNVIMLGATMKGAPRELILSERTNTPVASAEPNRIAQQDNEDQEETPLNMNPPAGEEPPRPPVQPIPGQNPNGSIRTPQQMLMELQQMRQRQQQEQQANPQ